MLSANAVDQPPPPVISHVNITVIYNKTSKIHTVVMTIVGSHFVLPPWLQHPWLTLGRYSNLINNNNASVVSIISHTEIQAKLHFMSSTPSIQRPVGMGHPLTVPALTPSLKCLFSPWTGDNIMFTGLGCMDAAFRNKN